MQVEKQVTYILELDKQVFTIEDVPARVNEETGEQFFSPSTVEHLQQIILNGQQPDRFIEVPVDKYAVWGSRVKKSIFQGIASLVENSTVKIEL